MLVSLEAPDEFLRDRVMNLPEKLIEGTHNTEDKLNKRLTVYRENNTEDVTALNYFDELEVHPHIIGESSSCFFCRQNSKTKLIFKELDSFFDTS